MLVVSAKSSIKATTICIIAALALSGCGDSSNSATEASPSSVASSRADRIETQLTTRSNQNLPSYELVKDDSYESPTVSKVLWEIVVPQTVTKDSLTALLNSLYEKAKTEHGNPDVVSIRAYMSREHAESGMGQWIAQLGKTGLDPSPTVQYDDRQINQLGAKPQVRLGLSEDKRKQIYNEFVGAEDKAQAGSEEQYPDPLTSIADFDKREKVSDALQEKYKQKLARKYGLTRKQLDSIGREGLEKSWPMPQ